MTTLLSLALMLADPTPDLSVAEEPTGYSGECGDVQIHAGCETRQIWDGGHVYSYCRCPWDFAPNPAPCAPGEGDCSVCTDEACWDPGALTGRSLDAGTEVCSLDGQLCMYVPEPTDATAQALVLTTDDLPPPPTPELGEYKEVCILFLHVETQEIRRSCMMVKLTGVTCTSSGSGCEAPPEPTAVWLDGGEIAVDYADRESLLLRIE